MLKSQQPKFVKAQNAIFGLFCLWAQTVWAFEFFRPNRQMTEIIYAALMALRYRYTAKFSDFGSSDPIPIEPERPNMTDR